MAKKQSKHSRAARRAEDEKPEIELDDTGSDHERSSARDNVLEQIAIKQLRQKGDGRNKSTPTIPEGMDELTAISLGVHPEQKTSGCEQMGGRVGKPNAKKNRRSKAKQQRAQMVKDMLNEKIEQARTRHKIVRTYRNKDEEEEEEEATRSAPN